MREEMDELNRLEARPEVYAPLGSFEKPAEQFVPGPYYTAAEEVIPEIADDKEEEALEQQYAQQPLSEFPLGRRDFVKLFSLTTVAGVGACVKTPVEKAIPYVNQPIDTVPGVAVHYATTCASCPCACGVVVKTKEGHPVKLEGSPEHPISQGALCALGQAELQALYHPERLKSPQARHGFRLDDISWKDAFKIIADKAQTTSRIGIITGGSSGHRHSFFQEFLTKMGSKAAHLYTFEPNSLFASISKAHELAFGYSSLPRFELEEAKVLVGVGSDFLDVGTSVVYHTKGYTKGQAFNGKTKGRLIQFESYLSLTGAKADDRHVIRPGSEWLTTLLLVKALMDHSSSKGSTAERARIQEVLALHSDAVTGGYEKVGLTRQVFDQTAAHLLKETSAILVGGGANFDENQTMLQLLGVFANILVGAYDSVLMLHKGWVPNPLVAGSDIKRFISDASQLDMVFVIDANPVFTAPIAFGLEQALKKVPFVVSVQPFPNEVDHLAQVVLPSHHYLESWGDEQPVAGFWSTRQPAVRPTTDSRQAEDILLWVAATASKSMPYSEYRSYLEKKWSELHKNFGESYDFDNFFKLVLKKGFVGKLATRAKPSLLDIKKYFLKLPHLPEGTVLLAPMDHRFQDGRGAHMPILQEIGDSLTTITWDSWVAMNPNKMQELGLKRNQIVRIEGVGGWFEAAVYPMPGTHPDALVVPRGNGHKDKRSTISNGVGIDPLVAIGQGIDPLSEQPVSSGVSVKMTVTGEFYRLAAMQKHNDIGNRSDIVKKVSLETALSDKAPVDVDTVPDLFPKLEEADHKWGMAIDLEKCTGCGACMTACAIENNVPQVGRDQILVGREMHWIRLDRYFYGSVDEPTVTFQPVMCQHCNHAPCEAVCPVFATTHDPEGLNAMTYNRCVGTRYCANACPYKVRRFNWWTHKWNVIDQANPKSRNPRALNPDVTVRTRGVMEKCSFCVGRLRDAKHEAKKEGRLVLDGEVKTACQQTCPADAISFGNIKDKTSKTSKDRIDPRSYLMLGGDPKHGHYGLKTMPSVSYLAQVVHHMPDDGKHHTQQEQHQKTSH